MANVQTPTTQGLTALSSLSSGLHQPLSAVSWWTALREDTGRWPGAREDQVGAFGGMEGFLCAERAGGSWWHFPKTCAGWSLELHMLKAQ